MTEQHPQQPEYPQQPQHPQPTYQHPGHQQHSVHHYYHPTGAPKSHIAAILLSFFLGTLGIDRFYLGHVGLGIAKLLLSWATFGVWQLIDFILIILKGTNGLKQINWQ
ncbi:TM2 domain-containing protein [Nesterenkonia ebinurensis]|uniref:TM2 domain-containing protein n=1 Tax=Nesterenkonia ebinurensis TaxID=2608252 RepID=UPI00123CB461|nr:TM2 domain-containing protein [Nesterenkonia ebinurensis]